MPPPTIFFGRAMLLAGLAMVLAHDVSPGRKPGLR